MNLQTSSRKIRVVIPEAPAVQAAPAGEQRRITLENLRIGMLDNGKANAGHLLRFVADALSDELPVKSSIALHKAHVGMAAPTAYLDRLAAEADIVVSAMAE